VNQHHAEVLAETLGQEVPFETSVQKPDFRILSLQVGFTLSSIQEHKAHLPNHLYCKVRASASRQFYQNGNFSVPSLYVGQSENKFPHFISWDRVELVGCYCVLCPQAAFLVCCGTYGLHHAGGAGAVLC
jgi:hypothetical protein